MKGFSEQIYCLISSFIFSLCLMYSTAVGANDVNSVSCGERLADEPHADKEMQQYVRAQSQQIMLVVMKIATTLDASKRTALKAQLERLKRESSAFMEKKLIACASLKPKSPQISGINQQSIQERQITTVKNGLKQLELSIVEEKDPDKRKVLMVKLRQAKIEAQAQIANLKAERKQDVLSGRTPAADDGVSIIKDHVNNRLMSMFSDSSAHFVDPDTGESIAVKTALQQYYNLQKQYANEKNPAIKQQLKTQINSMKRKYYKQLNKLLQP